MLVTGGARSGKSRFAESRLLELAPRAPWGYFATAEPLDGEMAERIARHRERRGNGWQTIEAPRALTQAITEYSLSLGGGLVDCLTLWLSNRIFDGASDELILDEVGALGRAIRAQPTPIVVVTNEVGAGIVPENPLARRFRDLAGFANQRLATHAHEVFLIACGLPLRLR